MDVLRESLQRNRDGIKYLTGDMGEDVAAKYFARCDEDDAALAALDADRQALAERNAELTKAIEAQIAVVCECDGENGGVGAIDAERSSFDYGADAYDGAGNVIKDYFDCPCAPLRAALAVGQNEAKA